MTSPRMVIAKMSPKELSYMSETVSSSLIPSVAHELRAAVAALIYGIF